MSIAEGVVPLPGFTAGKWLSVYMKPDDSMARRWLSVMHHMDLHYRLESPFLFGYSLAHKPTTAGASYYLWTPQFELALRMAYNTDYRRHEVSSVGFYGDIAPSDALDLIVDKALLHMVERRLTSVFCLCPKQMEYAPLLELYDLVPTHPRIRVTVEAETDSVMKWKLEAVELLEG